MININNTLKDKVTLGVNIFNNISVPSCQAILSFVKSETEQIRVSHLESLPPGYQNSRKLYRSFGIDPTKYRPSSEALWRRVKKGELLPEVNPFVDLTNFLSLKYQISYGLYDIRKIDGGIVLTTGGEGDGYEGIRKDWVSLFGRPALTDGAGPFGNPSSDSFRTSTDKTSLDILQVIFFTPDDENKELILRSSEALYRKFMKISDTHSYLS